MDHRSFFKVGNAKVESCQATDDTLVLSIVYDNDAKLFPLKTIRRHIAPSETWEFQKHDNDTRDERM